MPREPRDDRRRSRRSGGSLRLFVAAYPPASVVDRLVQEAARLDLPPHRLLPLDQVHLTALFIGETDPGDLGRIEESVARAAAAIAPLKISPDRLVTLPRRGPARLVAASAPCPPALEELHQRLRKRLLREVREGSEFLPHITLLRFSPPRPGLKISEELAGVDFDISGLRLVRSHLSPEGAHHQAISEIPLAGRL